MEGDIGYSSPLDLCMPLVYYY